MVYHLGVEDMEPGKWLAWVFELTGCFSRGSSESDAIAGARPAVEGYFEWVGRHGRPMRRSDDEVEIEVAETFYSYASENDYLVNAFFEDDRRPLTDVDAEEGLWLLGCTRRDLAAVLDRIPRERFERPIPGDAFGSLEKIAEHVATAEWWYFDRLGMAFPWAELPEGLGEKLEKVRAQTVELLPKLVGDGRIVERRGERWSARKVLRRALWHERVHTWQLARLGGIEE
jgi:predicted RNase H-like HicB family nuclease